jgi:hypothetical protein
VCFSFSATGFSFTSTSAEYAVAAGGTVTIHGTGKVNGVSGYAYHLVVVDGKPDSVLLDVWSSVSTSYALDSGSPLQTGSLTIK